MNTFDFDETRPIDVICMGRVAIDLYAQQIHCALADASTFRKYLGGCAGNIAVGTARLGLQSMMFSCVGRDEMGRFIKKTLQREGVATQLLYETDKHLTGLVLLGIDPPNHFPLMFYRNECADMQLKPEHINAQILKMAKALLITGTSLSTESMRNVTHLSVNLAQQLKTKIIIDLDYRPVLWDLTSKGNGETRFIANDFVTQQYKDMLHKCDLIIGTEEELLIASGGETIDDAIKILRVFTYAPIIIKKGKDGCTLYTNHEVLRVKSFPVKILNVLGAGDAFISGLLYGLLRKESFERSLQYANACGALVVTRHGCAPAMPSFAEMQYFIEQHPYDDEIWSNPKLVAMHKEIEPESDSSIVKFSRGFPDGLTNILTQAVPVDTTDMHFSCLKLRMHEVHELSPGLESAYLLMTGKLQFNYHDMTDTVSRTGYFEEDPILLHCAANTKVTVQAITDCELLIIQTANEKVFNPILFNKTNLLESDHRGKDLLHDTSYRIVRTVFDKRNRPESNLVIGEIITFQGHWSSYPPHYHPQSEVYHYRFSEPQGFAYAEKGDEVIRIQHNDTYKIPAGHTHSHCVAPGYALYTLWFIRHLPNNPYYVPTFKDEHAWTKTKVANRRVYQGNML